jgi:drug/metabolite transporter (DMT)-like permease
MCMIPVWTWLIAVGVRQERFRWKRALGVALAFAGTVPLAQMRLTGNGLMIANTLCYSIYLVIAKPLTAKYPPLVVLAWVYLLSLPAVPFLLLGRSLLPAAPGDAEIWWSFGYVLVGATVLSYVLNLFGLARVRSSTTAFYIYLQPLITAVAAWWMLGEEVPGTYAFAAVGLVLGGVLVLDRRRH